MKKEEKKEITEEKDNPKETKHDKKKDTEQKKHPLLKKFLIFILIVGVISLLWSRYISTSGLIVKEYPIKTVNLSTDYDGFKIVQFSDLHYGSTVFEEELKRIVKKINQEEPDIIVFTGDLVEQNVELSDDEVNSIIKQLKKLDANIEIFAVKGNHDYESDYFDRILTELGWNFLDNKYEFVYSNSKSPIIFVGLDDLLLGTPDYDNAFSYLNDLKEEAYTIVLTHEPDQIDEFKNYKFDLVLSGHSHLGQVRLPFIGALYTPEGSKKYYDEHYQVNDADLYISGGIGTSTLPLRFFNKPSINLYRFFTN